MTDPSPGSRSVGPWTLLEELGRGGNAVVYRAARSGTETPVALKVLNTTKVGKEPYRRFIREIGFLREHSDFSGVLPLLDFNLPERRRSGDPAWLAMPIAKPIAEALVGSTLSEIVAAIAYVADTLARLKDECGVAHRDVKPGNLYELDGEWLIGDFGLVALPDTEDLTREGRPLGPIHFMAHEMLVDAAAADPFSADVFALGKTLWVLATGQRYPPPGNQPPGTMGLTIGDLNSHVRADVLDREVDLMTRISPKERPTMRQAARDLVAWQSLAKEPVPLDLSAASSRFHLKVAPTLSEQDRQLRWKELVQGAIRRLQELTKPINAQLKILYTETEIDAMADKLAGNMLQVDIPRRHRVILHWDRCTIVAPSDHPAALALRAGRAVDLLDDGEVLLQMMVIVHLQGVMGTSFYWASPTTSARVGTAELDKIIEDGVKDLAAAVVQGVEVFVDAWPADRPESVS